ncbi:hypothetical protein [Atlantibacter hermannii]|uniref:hypothetical protein n=1 Tax=Atlantibacter hermannii TaxID=565 RepID=UPI002802F416|nr:hypothetical protein [Atlantibacter hermannii]MDQ7880759.1 hypothetical protein [Atlantibacter hermannii]
MAVNLKLIQAPAIKPQPPVWWMWLLLLGVMLLAGTVGTILNSTAKPQINANAFWETALGLPALFWLVLLIVRSTWYKGQLAIARSRDNEREKRLRREILRGRRFLHVLGISLHTGLREHADTDGQRQRNALLKKTQILKTQPSWKSQEGIRHSRLVRSEGETAEQTLTRVLNKTLEELSTALASVPADVPLSLLMESNTSLQQRETDAIWQKCWAESHIRQPVTRIEGFGLDVVDQWLDYRSTERAMLLVVAIQIVPDQPEGTAESVVGLLLGNPTLDIPLLPLAYLHRPEQAHLTGADDLQYAMQQALSWGELASDDLKSGWSVGIKPEWYMAIATGLLALKSPINPGQDLRDLNTTLGYAGPAAPWVAIASATQGCSDGAAQLIVSGDNCVDTPLWVTVMKPAKE